MKHVRNPFFLSLMTILLCRTLTLNGQVPNVQIPQDSYGSLCNLGREVMILKNKYVVEFIVPIGWQRDNSLLKSLRIESFYPEIDSINRSTNISIRHLTFTVSKTNVDSIIQKDKENYPRDWNFVKWDNQKNPFHYSVPNGRLFLVNDNGNNIKESIAYISSDDYIVTFVFKPSSSVKYSDYINVYTSFISSIRCSNLPR